MELQEILFESLLENQALVCIGDDSSLPASAALLGLPEPSLENTLG